MNNFLPQDVVRVHLDTTSRFSARLAAHLVDSMAASIEGNPAIGDPKTYLIASGEGTWWAHLLVIGGSIGACVVAAQGLAEEIRQGRSPFSRVVSAAIDEGNGRNVTFSADHIEIKINITEMPSYPPPVGEDRTTWIRKLPPPALDWPKDSKQPGAAQVFDEFNSLAEVFDLIQKTGDLEQEDLQPRSATTRQMWKNSWDSSDVINVTLEEPGEQRLLIVGTFRAAYPLALIESAESKILLQGLGRGLPIEDGAQVTVVGKHEATFSPINAMLVQPYRIMKYKER